jgi:hypothetical protein
VVTGSQRGAGTHSAAWVQLIGTGGESEKFLVGNSDDVGLQRGSTVRFDVQAPKELGALRRVHVERAKGSVTDTGEGWYLDHVEVDGPQGDHYAFPCHSWFGRSDCGDYTGAWLRARGVHTLRWAGGGGAAGCAMRAAAVHRLRPGGVGAAAGRDEQQRASAAGNCAPGSSGRACSSGWRSAAQGCWLAVRLCVQGAAAAAGKLTLPGARPQGP